MYIAVARRMAQIPPYVTSRVMGLITMISRLIF
jgi:hypothetical protein